jgi:hypothetical protein
MPFTTELAAELRTCTVGNDEPTTSNRARALPRLDHDTRYAVTGKFDIDRASALDRCHPGAQGYLTNCVIKFKARCCSAVIGE